MQTTKAEYHDWKSHPTTKAFKLELNEALDQWKEALTSGATLGGDLTKDTALAVGAIAALDSMDTWKPDFIDEDSEELE